MFARVTDAIREGETIAKPMGANARPGFHPVAMFLWFMTGAFVPLMIMSMPGMIAAVGLQGLLIATFVLGLIGVAYYLIKMNTRVVDELVVNMVDVGEETGELDTMLYKVADTYDEEVAVITESLVSLLEPLLIIFLGGAVGFIVIALFLPLVKLIESLT